MRIPSIITQKWLGLGSSGMLVLALVLLVLVFVVVLVIALVGGVLQ